LEPVYLFDPWLVEFNQTDTSETILKRYSALKKMQELHRKYGMRRVGFITIDQLHEFYANHTKSQRNDIREIAQIFKSILITPACQAQSVEIIERPLPVLPDQWLNALGGSSADWRRPIIVLPEVRTASWPNHTLKDREIKYKVNGSTEPSIRNLVCIESYDQHTYFEPDLDPWRIGSVGTPTQKATGAIGERREAMRRLPRPLHLLPLTDTFTQIYQKLQGRIEWSCNHAGEAYFIPEQGWDPRTITQEIWRQNQIFRTGALPDGRRGNLDRENRIWLWDPKENHWDVQFPKGGYYSVSHDGRILKKRL
jgi:hypothetical protein